MPILNLVKLTITVVQFYSVWPFVFFFICFSNNNMILCVNVDGMRGKDRLPAQIETINCLHVVLLWLANASISMNGMFV